jgi:GNAT superfamily N-acetyltransferase
MSAPTAESGGRPPVRIERADATSTEAKAMVASYLAEISASFGYDATRGGAVTDDDFAAPTGAFLIVRDDDGTAVGCGAVRLLDPSTAEVKRMWLDSSMRGRGAGRALLAALETEAVGLGATRGVLDTNATLASALALYRATGWVEVPKYNDNDEATHWFAKDLTG